MKYKTQLVSKASVVKANSNEFKAVASSLKDKYGFDLKPQMDLMYVRSCLVSAGDSVGVNENDDIFTREEVWASRHTPVLKPFNWQHQDKDILGVIYTVQARDLNDNILDIDDETPPDCDFDLWVEAAVFKLIHEDRANEIERRSEAGQLFVSMEAWFDDYAYGLYNPEDKSINSIVDRNKNTTFLDQHLRVQGGSGKYRDPDSNQDLCIGRSLRKITFGGCGFVDCPANKRSVIEVAEPMNSFAGDNESQQIELLLQRVLEKEIVNNKENLMNTQAGQNTDLKAAVNDALSEREKIAAAKKEREDLQAKATAAEVKNEELAQQLSELNSAQEAQEAQKQQLQEQLNSYEAAVDNIVTKASAGATNDTPAEIAAIDNASDGADAFAAKLSWLEKSMAQLQARAERADELEVQLAEAELVVREQEVRALLGGVVSNEAVDSLVSHASNLDSDAYATWRDEKELFALEFASAKEDEKEMKNKKLPPFMKKGKDKEMDKEEDKSSAFRALLEQRRSESMANPDTMNGNPNEPDLINQNTGDVEVNSGVNSGQLKTPRHKIAGSAGDDPADILENAQDEGGVQLAGANASGDGEAVNAFRSLASIVVNQNDVTPVAENGKPDFDPVQ